MLFKGKLVSQRCVPSSACGCSSCVVTMAWSSLGEMPRKCVLCWLAFVHFKDEHLCFHFLLLWTMHPSNPLHRHWHFFFPSLISGTWYLIVVLICMSPIINQTGHLFICLLAILTFLSVISFLRRFYIKDFKYIGNFFILGFSLIIGNVYIFCKSVTCSFTFLILLFVILIWMQSNSECLSGVLKGLI